MQYFTLLWKDPRDSQVKPREIRVNRPRGELLDLVEKMYPHYTRTSLHNWNFKEEVDGVETVTAEAYLEPARKRIDHEDDVHV